MNGDTENAIEVYKEVLKNSPQDFNANLFMGNYYYILGKNQIDTLNINYKKKNSPSIHDYAEYRDRLNILYRTYYEPAIRYLEIASVNNENKVIKNTLNEMFDLRDEFNTNGKKRRKK